MRDQKALYGYDPYGSSEQNGVFVSLMLVGITALAATAVLFAYRTPWFLLPLAIGALALYGIVKIDTLMGVGRCLLYRVPRAHAAVVHSAYFSGWRRNLIESPRAAVFAKSLVEDDYADRRSVDNSSGFGPRVLADGRTYWGFFHDNDERVDNPFYAAWLAARVLDEKSEAWDSMPRLLSIASTVRNYVEDRESTGATTVTSLTMAWFYSEMSDDEAEATLAEHGPELTRLLLEGVSMEYAREML